MKSKGATTRRTNSLPYNAVLLWVLVFPEVQMATSAKRVLSVLVLLQSCLLVVPLQIAKSEEQARKVSPTAVDCRDPTQTTPPLHTMGKKDPDSA
eukprot:2009079-Amphidinium_carterae.1